MPNVNFFDPKLIETLDKAEENEDRKALDKMLLSLAICHNIVIDSATGQYNAASSDELALVRFAQSVGYVFKGKDENDNYKVRTPGNCVQTFQLLHECAFSSARKRMSVILRIDGKI